MEEAVRPRPLRGALGRLLLFLLRLEHLTTVVVAAAGAHGVLRHRHTTIAAVDQLGRHERVVRAATVTATLRMLALWLRRHCPTPVDVVRLPRLKPSGRTGCARS